MNKTNFLKLAMTFAGCFLGAGYVSGQEMWQFFGTFGVKGIVGFIFAISLICVFGILILRLIKIAGIKSMDEVVIRQNIPILHGAVGTLEILFLFGIYVIMAAGVASLLFEIFALPKFFGSLIFCSIITLASLKGLDGMITAFSIAVPLLVVTTIAIGIISLSVYGFPQIESSYRSGNPLINNWIISAITYVSYNLFGAIGIIFAVSRKINKKSMVYSGIILGGVLLLFIGFGVLISIFSKSGVSKSDLPMLEAANSLSPVLYYFYALLLLLAMFATSLSGLIATTTYIESRMVLNNIKKKIFTIVISFFAFLGSLFGFGDLIGVIYPIFGYIGFAVLVLILYNFFMAKRKAKQKSQ